MARYSRRRGGFRSRKKSRGYKSQKYYSVSRGGIRL